MNGLSYSKNICSYLCTKTYSGRLIIFNSYLLFIYNLNLISNRINLFNLINLHRNPLFSDHLRPTPLMKSVL